MTSVFLPLRCFWLAKSTTIQSQGYAIPRSEPTKAKPVLGWFLFLYIPWHTHRCFLNLLSLSFAHCCQTSQGKWRNNQSDFEFCTWAMALRIGTFCWTAVWPNRALILLSLESHLEVGVDIFFNEQADVDQVYIFRWKSLMWYVHKIMCVFVCGCVCMFMFAHTCSYVWSLFDPDTVYYTYTLGIGERLWENQREYSCFFPLIFVLFYPDIFC